MRFLSVAAIALALAATLPTAHAQPFGGPGNPGQGPFSRYGPPQHPGPFAGGYGMHGGSPYGTATWMLTREEFREHLERLLALRTYEECQAYMAAHHAALVERARHRGQVWYPGGYSPVCDYFR